MLRENRPCEGGIAGQRMNWKRSRKLEMRTWTVGAITTPPPDRPGELFGDHPHSVDRRRPRCELLGCDLPRFIGSRVPTLLMKSSGYSNWGHASLAAA